MEGGTRWPGGVWDSATREREREREKEMLRLRERDPS